tara:strand:- start:1737 stop:2828 length:1092 start_codon:yes stop_codon:yes gene_type:complete
MAFLDNSGDIILDAVLTDMGRKRLASGRFTVSKFALGDEEINYELWDPSDARGTAFYDLQIMQTPILEAFTSDQSLMKSRLISFSRNDLLYLPILKLNNSKLNTHSRPYGTVPADSEYVSDPSFYVLADETTRNMNEGAPGGSVIPGIIYGVPGQTATDETKFIAIDQGIQAPGDSPLTTVSPFDPVELQETAFIVKVDNRLLSISTVGNEGQNQDDVQARAPQYLDDDYVASYYFTRQQADGAIKDGAGTQNHRLRNTLTPNADPNTIATANKREVFNGPLGRTLQIVPTVKPELRLSDAIFKELGYEGTELNIRSGLGGAAGAAAGNLANYYLIETTITVQGMTTGNSIDIPIRIVRGKFS